MNQQALAEIDADIEAFKKAEPLVMFYRNLTIKAAESSQEAMDSLAQARKGYGADHPITMYLLAEATRLHFEATSAHAVFDQAQKKHAAMLAEISAKYTILKAQAV